MLDLLVGVDIRYAIGASLVSVIAKLPAPRRRTFAKAIRTSGRHVPRDGVVFPARHGFERPMYHVFRGAPHLFGQSTGSSERRETSAAVVSGNWEYCSSSRRRGSRFVALPREPATSAPGGRTQHLKVVAVVDCRLYSLSGEGCSDSSLQAAGWSGRHPRSFRPEDVPCKRSRSRLHKFGIPAALQIESGPHASYRTAGVYPLSTRPSSGF
jgi:hypothetical protein